MALHERRRTEREEEAARLDQLTAHRIVSITRPFNYEDALVSLGRTPASQSAPVFASPGDGQESTIVKRYNPQRRLSPF